MRGIGIQLTNDFDLDVLPVRGADGKIQSGFRLAETLPQNQAVILTCHAGEIKEVPYLGVGISDIVLDNDWLSWRRKIRMQMELDRQQVKEVKLINGKLIIDAKYINQ